MLNKDLRAWLSGLLPEVPSIPGPGMHDDYTGRHLVVTPVAGAGFSTEWLFENPGFQIRTIGDPFRGDSVAAMDDAEALAYEVDRAVLTAPFPQKIGGKHVVRIQRLGDITSLLLDDAERQHMVGTYIVEVQSGY